MQDNMRRGRIQVYLQSLAARWATADNKRGNSRGHSVMPAANANEFAYLCVDQFLQTFVNARVLKTALELQVIDRLKNPHTPEELMPHFAGDRGGLVLLLELLAGSRVVEEHRGTFRLSAS